MSYAVDTEKCSVKLRWKIFYPRYLSYILLLFLTNWVFGDIPFKHHIIDSHGPKDPWAKIIADIDGDGDRDVIVGGRKGPLVWYAYPKWTKSVITPGGYKTVDGEAGDIDGDGDLDIVLGGLFWYENPLPRIHPSKSLWKTHKIANHPTHDIELADLNGDGRLDIVTRDQSEFGHRTGNKLYLWWQSNPKKWTHTVIECPHGEGLELADLDRDNDPDIVIGGTWYENTGQIDAVSWIPHSFAQFHPNASIAVADFNRDNRLDMVLAPAELKQQYYKIAWYEAPKNPRQRNWTEHVLAEKSEAVIHSLQSADLNNDQLPDIIAAEMHQGQDPDEVILFIDQSKGHTWQKQVISIKGSHLIQTGDIDSDGDIDLMGANWSGPFQPIEFWENIYSKKK